MSDKSLPEGYENFCSAPWSTIYIEPSGAVGPCCIIKRPADTYGNLNDDSFTDIVNGEKLKEFRRKFINNERPSECEACWKREQFPNTESLRHSFNNKFYDERFISETDNDGYYDGFDIKYWDVRPNNICNLGCVMCCEDLSSGFHQLMEDLGTPSGNKKFNTVSNDRFDDVFRYMKTVVADEDHRHFYFAGGEPLIMPEHKKFLDYFVENKLFNIELRYNTNLSSLTFKGVDWIEVWKQFKNVNIDISIDASGIAGEYQRFGSKWSVMKENIQRLVDSDINVTFNFVVTMITYPHLLNTIHELEEIIPRDKLIPKVSMYATDEPNYMALKMTPTICLDKSIIATLKEMGYNTLSIENHLATKSVMLNEYNWKRIIDLADRMKKFKHKDLNDVLPWFNDYTKKFR